MASSKSKYGCCLSQANSAEVLKCQSCRKPYHFSCINVAKNQFKDLSQEFKGSWLCPVCRSKQVKADNTPIRSMNCDNEDNITLRRKDLNTASNLEHSPENIRSIIREELNAKFNDFKATVNKRMDLQTKELVNELNELKKSMNFIEQQYEDIKAEFETKTITIKSLENENTYLRSTVTDLNLRITSMEQQTRAANVEIQCVPESKSEVVTAIVQQIAATVKFKMNDSDIHLCTRTAKISKDNNRPRSIVVKFSSPRVRDGYLAATATFNKKANGIKEKLNTSHIGFGGEKKPIYVAEHLSPAMKSLHASTRIKAKELNYKYVWIKNGRVFIRKSETTGYILIKNKESLANLT